MCQLFFDEESIYEISKLYLNKFCNGRTTDEPKAICPFNFSKVGGITNEPFHCTAPVMSTACSQNHCSLEFWAKMDIGLEQKIRGKVKTFMISQHNEQDQSGPSLNYN